ncbi:uncharacterized protein LOC123865507 [Maniola jurtina]|uniref:uncharacterized protein LOC123865507 n=1 Tax=Maniola jurtina TaxID=191418 RepID=UPI001E6870B8|nr:uncharacterized protein LOC123865507 [Maniola jurtina]
MNNFVNRVSGVAVCILLLICFRDCTKDVHKIDKKYHLVREAYDVARSLFLQGRNNYNQLKNTSLLVMDTFLDLVRIMNTEMAKKLRGAVIKFYKIKYFHDFTNYVITLEEMIDITEHCLSGPAEKLEHLRSDFHFLIRNFQDVRLFHTVHKCHNELPDEVAAAHCILHQAVLFNETMQESLVSIVEIKTNQHARKMNASLYEVPKCLNSFVPNFFEQLLVDAYTEKCGFLKVVNASIEDLTKGTWRSCKDTLFSKKWTPLVEILKQKYDGSMTSQSLLLTLLSANLTSNDIMKTLYS